MSLTSRLDGRHRLVAVVAVVLALVGVLVLVLAFRGQGGPPQPADQPLAADVAEQPATARADEPAAPAEPGEQAEAPTAGQALDFGPVMEGSTPVGLEIPAIGLTTDVLVPLTVGADGILPAPVDHATAGWHTRGPTPGQLGPAVIAGHVDGPDGPAIFYRLGELVAGDVVSVTREDGSVARFTVDSVGRYPKAEFPTSEVYGNTTDRAEIRLITCGGAFDRTTGHYVDNIVVFGHLTP